MSTISSTGGAGTTTANAKAAGLTSAADQEDRFMKLLVAQMKNQDPLNPMDNAQMTSQMAQINTVTGITQLNETMKSLSSQFLSMQILQSSGMVGHHVLVAGDTLNITNGVAAGAVELAAGADTVTVDILSPGGQVLDTFNLGAKDAGRHEFTWDASAYGGQAVKLAVKASAGSNKVAARPMAVEKIESISNESGALKLNLQSGKTISYSDVAALY